jgi:glycogen phosphorylase
MLTRYLALLEDGAELQPRTVIVAGKAAPGYTAAKLIIKLITSIADLVNHDRRLRNRLKVVFLPDFNVKNASRIYPAADLSEQISMASTEASGTGNMKFAMNGALTIGTLDGANIEIRDAVGAENFFLFGLTADQVREAKANGYSPRVRAAANPRLGRVLDLIASGVLSRGDATLFRSTLDELLNRDEYLLFADYDSYVDTQQQVDVAFADRESWTRKSILTVARMGRFSSDRAIREYCEQIWHAEGIATVAAV